MSPDEVLDLIDDMHNWRNYFLGQTDGEAKEYVEVLIDWIDHLEEKEI